MSRWRRKELSPRIGKTWKRIEAPGSSHSCPCRLHYLSTNRKISAHFGRLSGTDNGGKRREQNKLGPQLARRQLVRNHPFSGSIPSPLTTSRFAPVGSTRTLYPSRHVGSTWSVCCLPYRLRSGRDVNDVSVTAEVEIQPRDLRSWTSEGWSRNRSAERINVRLLCET